MEIEIGDTEEPYLNTNVTNPYYDSFRPSLDTIKFENLNGMAEEMSERPTSGFYVDHSPSFNGGNPDEFSKWISKRINNELQHGKYYNCDVIVQFIVTDEGRISKVNSLSLKHKSDNLDMESLLLRYIGELSPKWKPAVLFSLNYNTPMYMHIKMYKYMSDANTIIHQYNSKYFNIKKSKLDSESPYYERLTGIPSSMIIDSDKSESCPLCMVNLNNWIKQVVQNGTVFVGYKFHNGHTRIEAIISQRGWVYSAKVIESDDEWLGEWLAENMLRSPRWIPAKIGGKAVASRIMVDYDWTFDD